MQKLQYWLAVGLIIWTIGFGGGQSYAAQASDVTLQSADASSKRATFLSTYWPQNIQRWASLIYKVSYINGLDPDLVAAVVMAESKGDSAGVSHTGAVGLMGIVPSEPGLEWRPTAEELIDPNTNLRWGVAVLSDIIQQSGGDIYAALAAYNGGWSNADRTVPQRYAAEVLDQYGRAVVVRSGNSPDIAAQWTVAIEMRRGYVPVEPLLVLGRQPFSGLERYGKHILYDYVNKDGTAFFVIGYAVPVSLVVPEIVIEPPLYNSSDTLELALRIRLGLVDEKNDTRNPRVLLTCLATSSRLRGQDNTRWFAPSSCPEWRQP